MRFHSDVCLCANHIYCELTGQKPPQTLWEMRDICERYGRTLVVDCALPAKHGGEWDGERIRVSGQLSREGLREVIPHELVHSLTDTATWFYLNYLIQGWKHERDDFLESVASLVGLMFRYDNVTPEDHEKYQLFRQLVERG